MTRSTSLSWFPFEMAGFTHGRISEASLAAQGLWMHLLCAAFQSGDITFVKSRPTYLANIARKPVDEITPLLAELIEIGSLELDDDCLHIYGTEHIHAELLHKRAGARNRQRSKRERDRQQDTSPDVVATASPNLAASDVPTLEDVAGRLWAACDAATADVSGAQAVGVYRLLHAQAAEFGAAGGKYHDVKGVGPKKLSDIVVAHAAQAWLSIDPQNDADQRRLSGLSKLYGAKVFDAFAAATGRVKSDPFGLVRSILDDKGQVAA